MLTKNNLVLSLLVFLGIILFVFRSLVINISTNLIDWYDYPLVVWIISQNVDKILALEFSNFFTTNAFYPLTFTLLFAENLIVPSLLAVPFSLFTNNQILVFNLVFLLTFLLNYISLYLFWDKLFKNAILSFLGALFVIFSPFFFNQLGHFQMMSYWPFFFGFYFILEYKERGRNINLILAGIFAVAQFLSSVYLAIYFLLSVALYYFIQFVFENKRWATIKSLVTVFLTFLIVGSVFIKGYLYMKTLHEIERPYGEFVTYSAHLTDYIFTKGSNALFYDIPLIEKWNVYNKHGIGETASFPGFLLTSLFIFGLLRFSFPKKRLSIALNLDKERSFFISLVLIGFIFSLGPRLSVNGAFVDIPLPYHLFLKSIPLLESIRVAARWSFLLYAGVAYFALTYLKKRYSLSLLLIVFVFFTLEYMPLRIQTHSEVYIEKADVVLNEICDEEKKVVLEIPVTHLYAKGGPITGLNYISKTVLASSHHGCYLVNGYAGFDFPYLQKLQDDIYTAAHEGDVNKLYRILSARNVDLVIFNKTFITDENLLATEDLLIAMEQHSHFSKITHEIYLLK